MKTKTISFCQGKGSLAHNNREFAAKNVDSERTRDNITFVHEPIGLAYERCFGDAVRRYNACQKRRDRQITDYYEHTFRHPICNTVVTAADKRKSFYEDIVQIGTMQDSGIGTPDAVLVAECLTEYMNCFEERNPNFYVFNAVLHMDEATPHLHIDYIPIGHYTRGLDTQNGEAKALEEMGFGTGRDAINRWRERERRVLVEICQNHGIEISAPQKSRGSYSVEEYKRIQRQIEALTAKMETLDADIQKKLEQRDGLLHYVPDYDQRDKQEHELLCLASEFDALLSSPIARLSHKDALLETSARLVKMVERAQDARLHAEAAHAEAVHENGKFAKYTKKLEQANISLREKLAAVRAELTEKTEILGAISCMDSSVVERAKTQLAYEKRQREEAERLRQEQRKRGQKRGR